MSDEPKRTETKPAMPAQPATTQIQALTDRALLEMLVGRANDLSTKVDTVNDKVDTLAINVEILQDDGRDTKARIIRLEGWKEGVDNRLNSNSQRAKQASSQTSEVDMKYEAAISSIIVDVKDLKVSQAAQTALLKTNTTATVATQQQLLDAAAGFWKRNPKLETALVAVIIAAAGAAVLFLNALVHK